MYESTYALDTTGEIGNRLSPDEAADFLGSVLAASTEYSMIVTDSHGPCRLPRRASRDRADSIVVPDPLLASTRVDARNDAEPALRIFLVSDHAALAAALAELLRREGMEIAGMASTLAEARRVIERRVADVMVLDVRLQGENGLDLVSTAHAHDVRVLLYTGAVAPATAPGAEAPDGTASKVGTKAELLAAIRQVAGGQSPRDPRVEAAVPSGAAHLLTAREREIVTLLARGLSGEEIAESLFLSPHTVRTHIRNASGRMQAKTRAHLVTLAAEAGEITLSPDAVTET